MILATAGVWETVAVKTIFDMKVHFPVTQEVYQGEMARARMLIASPNVYILGPVRTRVRWKLVLPVPTIN